jgi:hypothetical protein
MDEIIDEVNKAESGAGMAIILSPHDLRHLSDYGYWSFDSDISTPFHSQLKPNTKEAMTIYAPSLKSTS